MKQTNQDKLSSMRLLVVEDEEDFLASYKFALERQCKILDLATNEKDALTMITENDYDVVITDGAIPEYEGGNVGNHGTYSPEDYRGRNVAQAAKEKGTYVIGISSQPEKLDCESIDVLMKKPYDVLELFQILALQPTREKDATASAHIEDWSGPHPTKGWDVRLRSSVIHVSKGEEKFGYEFDPYFIYEDYPGGETRCPDENKAEEILSVDESDGKIEVKVRMLDDSIRTIFLGPSSTSKRTHQPGIRENNLNRDIELSTRLRYSGDPADLDFK